MDRACWTREARFAEVEGDDTTVAFPPEPVDSVVLAPVPELKDYSDRADMWLVIRALKKRNPVRQAAERVMQDPTERRLPFEELITQLYNPNGFRWKERTLAAWLIGMNSPTEDQRREAVEALLKIFNRQDGNDRQGAFWRCLLRSLPVGIIIGIVFVLVEFVAKGRSDLDLSVYSWLSALLVGIAMSLGGTLLSAPLVYPFSKAIEADCLNQVRAAAARALGRLEIPESVGPLAETIASRVAAPRLKRAAESALPEAARALTSAHYGRLGAAITPSLCRVAHHRSEGLAAHALAALAKVGDGRALEEVRRIAKRGPSRLRPWAERALPILEERHRRENAPKTLLRAAEAATDDDLLRPAGASGYEDPDSLLRPSEDRERV